MDKPMARFEVPASWKVAFVTFILLLPAAFFWTSVIMRLGLGTDYYFDLVFEEMSQTGLGNMILVVMVVFMPAAAIGVNGLVYLKKRLALARWAMALGLLFLAAGFYAAVSKN